MPTYVATLVANPAETELSDAAIAHLDQASAVPAPYPYNMHREFMRDRNPIAPLFAPLPEPGGARFG